MIEWIGIICCSSLISCVCSLLTTSICLTVTGGKLRSRSKKVGKQKSQDALQQKSSESSKTPKNEEIAQKRSFSQIVSPEKLSQKQSYTNIDKNQQKSDEYIKQIEKTSLKDICDNLTCKNSIPVSVCCKIPTEAEIQKTIDDFNTLFRQYNEIIARNPKQEIKKSPSFIKAQPPNVYEKTINVGIMTEQENRESVSFKANSKIRKCRCTNSRKELRRHSSSQSVKVAKSCTCSVRRSKSDLCMRKSASSKSVVKSKSPRYAKHVNSKPSWISKTIKKFRSKDYRK